MQTMIADAGGERGHHVLLSGNRNRRRRTWTARGEECCDALGRARERVAWEEAR